MDAVSIYKLESAKISPILPFVYHQNHANVYSWIAEVRTLSPHLSCLDLEIAIIGLWDFCGIHFE